ELAKADPTEPENLNVLVFLSVNNRTSMETVGSCSSSAGDRNRDMQRLTEAFGSSLSLEAIASAYSQAGLNVEMAGVILYELQGNTSVASEDVKVGQHEVGVAGDESLRSGSSHESSRVLGSVSVKDDDMHEDIGAFLFQMLGDGFQLGMEKINEVLGELPSLWSHIVTLPNMFLFVTRVIV
ncbi:hypothetical protein KSS87_022879, partial [Heliosperma pusillum]